MVEFKGDGPVQVQVSAGDGRWSLIDADPRVAAAMMGDRPLRDGAWLVSGDGMFRVAASAVRRRPAGKGGE